MKKARIAHSETKQHIERTFFCIYFKSIDLVFHYCYVTDLEYSVVANPSKKARKNEINLDIFNEKFIRLVYMLWGQCLLLNSHHSLANILKLVA